MQQKMGVSGPVPEGRRTRGATVPCRLRDMVNLNRRLVMGEDGRRNPRTENLGALSHIVGGHFHYGMHTLVPQGRKYFYVTVVQRTSQYVDLGHEVPRQVPENCE